VGEGCAKHTVKDAVENAKRAVNGRFQNGHRYSTTYREDITMSIELIILIVVVVILFGGGGGYYWSRRG
jgi:hypothetical protein